MQEKLQGDIFAIFNNFGLDGHILNYKI